MGKSIGSLPRYLVDEMRTIEAALDGLGKGDLSEHRFMPCDRCDGEALFSLF